MQKVDLEHLSKDGNNVINTGVQEVPEGDVQQVAGKNYNPEADKYDMIRLGKRQELKVRAILSKAFMLF